ncbi:MucB/RseB C-terminal domain-containing protein [Marinobacterium arenosum]|uniref:MucB/RseB C-terminal domain-containing protein n=1 Tax=Marinobacterium arenosum TaxID=2862496 RepID=UPI001C97783D|nr:MucB/RseB C-terminal domain-containing protein [Marinobacterium arenosum]MBY4676781.1 MucB/RseB C-terminal domain-containing protein [Marinobacterium arenosum]
MNEQAVESLSAVMDGEASEFELRRTLEQLEQSPEIGEQWRRFHVARNALRGEPIQGVGVDISAGVMAAVEAEAPLEVDPAPREQAPASDERRLHNRFLKPLTSMAVAASVTAMVILGVQNLGQQSPAQLADSRPQYTLPSATGGNDSLMPAQFGNRTVLGGNTGQEPEVIRLSQGLAHYIAQHQHLLSEQKPAWSAKWLPEGFRNVRHEVMPQAEVMMFSDGRHAVSVCIEELGRQSVPEGVAQVGGMIAVGKRQGNKFVTVVGDVPLMIAERIAASVKTN